MSLTVPEDLKESLLAHGEVSNASNSTASSMEDLCILPPVAGSPTKLKYMEKDYQALGSEGKPAIHKPNNTNELEQVVSNEAAANTGNNSKGIHWLDLSASDNPLTVNDTESLILMNSVTLDNENGRECTCWKRDRNISKHEEAAVIIIEGEDDAKFYHHPTNKWSRKAYEILHHRFFYLIHLWVSVCILLLALAETPFIGESQLSDEQRRSLASVHAVLEMVFLTFLAMYVALHIIWLQSNFFKHRILVISVILLVLYVEAVVVIVRQTNHFRITRILRPFFLIDTHYMSGVRRVARQIMEVLKPIVDVLLLLIFFIFFFALFGYLIFAETDPDYFDTFSKSFLSLFITSSTANHPDVMMESYALYGATPIYFIIFLILTLYFAANVLLAVVYTSFSEVDKNKFKKLFCHKRDALLRAFHVLTSDSNSEKRLQFHDFLLVMHHFRPSMPEWQALCVFKSLYKDPQSQQCGLDEDDFLRFYDVLEFSWTQVDSLMSKLHWYTQFSPSVSKPIEFLYKIVSHRLYKFLMGLVVLVNLIFLVVCAHRVEEPSKRFEKFHSILPGTFYFLTVYTLDIILNIISYGPYDYFRRFWNKFDVLVIFISILSAIISVYHSVWVIVLPLKLIRLIRLKRSYRDLMKTIVDLGPRLLSIFVLILIIYYWFAIIGMEFLSGKVKENCCKNALFDVGQYYADSIEITNSSGPSSNVYYLNNFDHLLRSYATLFILMIVNNWYIIMEGFASEVDHRHIWLSRLYFIIFYMIMLVVLQVIIAFIVEAFQLKIQDTAKRRVCHKHPENAHCGCPQETKKKVVITLVEDELAKLRYEVSYMDENSLGIQGMFSNFLKKWRRKQFKIKNRKSAYLVGSRSHTKEDIHQLHYREEIKAWRKERTSRRSTGMTTRRTKWQQCVRVVNRVLDLITN